MTAGINSPLNPPRPPFFKGGSKDSLCKGETVPFSKPLSPPFLKGDLGGFYFPRIAVSTFLIKRSMGLSYAGKLPPAPLQDCQKLLYPKTLTPSGLYFLENHPWPGPSSFLHRYNAALHPAQLQAFPGGSKNPLYSGR